MSTTRPPQPGPNYFWSDLLKSWVPNSGALLDSIGKGATGGALTPLLSSVATGGAAKEAAQTVAAESLAQKILANKTALLVLGVGVVGLIAYLMSRKKA